jgi:GNAT superfamily N-acetyltransferase
LAIKNFGNYNFHMLSIRPATKVDVPLILDLICALAEYEREPDKAIATADDLVRDGFTPGSAPKFQVIIAEWDGAPAGFALFFYNYSTWNGRPGIYLEDLFVKPTFRKKGIGKALLIHLAQIAAQENCRRLEWQVLDWNTPAIDFYKSLGAHHMKEWFNMRVTGEALPALAALTSAQKGSAK